MYRVNEEMENVLVSVIKDITGAGSVMWNKQDAFIDDRAAVKPKLKDFVSLNYLTGPTPTTDPEYKPSGNGVGLFDLRIRFEFTLSVNIYTNNAHLMKMMKIAALIKSEQYRQRLKAVGLSPISTGGEGDFSEFDETRYNLRSHIDIYFSYISIEKDINLGSIEYFEATGKLGDVDSEVKVSKNEGIL